MNTLEKRLTAEQQRWVDDSFENMTAIQKVGQLFCISVETGDTEKLKHLIRDFQPGGFMFRPAPKAQIDQACAALKSASRIPLLLAANLECGGNGLFLEGTYFGRNLQIAATDDPIHAWRQGYICGAEGGAAGVNWAFSPVIDLDLNWRNPITNVRTYGNDPDRVIRMAQAYMAGMKEAAPNMAVCIKHFPGDGVDERDQHLLPTVNCLSSEAWWSSFGKIYQALIDEGAQTLMVGHILQPALTRDVDPSVKDKDILPASMSRELIQGIIREKLGFRGLIVTDSTNMVGYTALKSRREALATSLMAGVDMFLFCRNMEEDFQDVLTSLRCGEITEERLNEAVLSILRLKASLGLWNDDKKAEGTVNPEMFRCWASECADQAITLVKDNQQLLPLSPEKTRRIRLTVLGEREKTGSFGDGGLVTLPLKKQLEKNGFQVSLYDYGTLEDLEIVDKGRADLKEKFDLSMVVANIPTGSNRTTRRIDWIPLLAADCPWYVKDIPTLFISFCNPHHMADVPFISTFINAYTANELCVKACVDKLLGRSAFKGINPTDVWCEETWSAKVY